MTMCATCKRPEVDLTFQGACQPFSTKPSEAFEVALPSIVPTVEGIQGTHFTPRLSAVVWAAAAAPPEPRSSSLPESASNCMLEISTQMSLSGALYRSR
jgi:hypothetical protein